MSLLRVVRGRGRAEFEGYTIRLSDLFEAFPTFQYNGKQVLVEAVDSNGIKHDIVFGEAKRGGTTIYTAKKNWPTSLPSSETGKGGDRYITVLRVSEI